MFIVEKEKWNELHADLGKKLLSGDMIHSILYVPKKLTLEDLQKTILEIEDGDYVPPQEIMEEELNNLQALKENQIKLSKSNLSAYLKQNPMFSTVKYEEGRYYSVTQEKQMLLFRELFKHTLYPKHVLYWNSTGETYEEWTFEELKALSLEIEEYVRPLVRKQQELEIEIMDSISDKDILGIDLNSYKEVMI